MHTFPASSEDAVLETFQKKKILSINEITELMSCSAITSRRRLKQWRALTSYNQNNRYYTLPNIPVFSKSGLWRYRGVSFSKHGTCKQTVVHFVRISERGLSNTELADILGGNPNSLLAHFREVAGIRKERHGRDIVYFSSDEQTYRRQHQARFPPVASIAELPSDAQAVIILVELIHHPRIGVSELGTELRNKGHAIETGSIEALFNEHQIGKKKLNMKS